MEGGSDYIGREKERHPRLGAKMNIKMRVAQGRTVKRT